jgi:hypothetical protein
LSFPGNTAHQHEYGNIGQQPTKPNDVMRMFYAQSSFPLQPSRKLVDIKTPDKLSERMLKLKEIEILANKLYPRQNAKQIIIAAGMQVNAGDDDSLDKNLTFLRNVDRAKSY